MKTKLLTRMKRFLLSVIVACLGLVMAPNASAGVPYPESLYLTQVGDVTCTLVSNAMMLRARLFLDGNPNWADVTESSLAPYGWIEGAGQRSTYSCTFGGATLGVSQAYVGGLTVAQLQSILNEHPEGVCIYITSIPHAQWITDIEGGVVYSADSSAPVYHGRRPLSNTLQGQYLGSQDNVLRNVSSYWYVASNSGAVKAVTQDSPTLPNGQYRIACYSNATFGVDVAGGSQDDNANVHVWKYEGSPQQQFNVTFSGDHYNLQALHSSKNLDLQGASSASGTSVIQYTPDGTDVQNWVLREAGDGAYYVINKNGLYMDVANGTVDNSANIQGYTGNESAAQKWVFVAVNGEQSMPDGVYQLRSAKDFTFGLDVQNASIEEGANVQLYEQNGTDCQKWVLKYEGNGCYTLKAKHTGYALNVYGGYYKGNPNVQQYPYTEGDAASLWMLRDAGDGSFYVVNKNGSFLDINRGNMSNGENIGGWCGNSGSNQKWKLVAVDGEQTIADGCYSIRSAADQNFCLDVDAISTQPEANVSLYEYKNSNNQKWRVKYLGDGYYSIVAVHSGMALDVHDTGKNNGANIQQYNNTATSNTAQQWIIKDTGEGNYYVINRNGLFLDINAASVKNGTNIQGWTGNRSIAQKWVFAEEEIDNEAPVISNIQVSNVSESGYTVTCTVTDNVGVTKVEMPTWSLKDGQDDLVWHQAEISGNTATCTINTSDHNGEGGTYVTHIYAYDAMQNKAGAVAGEIDLPVANENPNRVPNGTYRIACYGNPSIVLDVEAKRTDDEANVHVWEYVGGDNQKWNITYVDGHYNIQAVHSSKNLDLYKAGNAAGTNVMQYTPDGTAVQNWTIQEASDGAFYVINSNGLYLDVADGNIASGSNVQGYTGNQSTAQKWLFIAVDGNQTLPNGDYRICIAKDRNSSIGVQEANAKEGTNVVLRRKDESDDQKWTVKYLGDGYYALLAKQSGLALNLEGAATTGNPNIQLLTLDEGDDGSMWILKELSDGSYYIINKNGLFVDLAGGKFTEGNNVDGYRGNMSDAQTFRFIAVDGERTIANGVYEIRNNANRDYTLDVDGKSTENNANVHLWENSGDDNQRWRVEYLNNGYYSIVSVGSSKALDLHNGSSDIGTNVQQYENSAVTGSTTQQWMIRRMVNDVYSIINRNGLFLDISGAKIENGSNVQGWSGNCTVAQQWLFVPVDDSDTEAPTITDVVISNVSQAGYQITCTIDDNVGVKSVKMPTWTEADGQDDIVWHEATIYGNHATAYIRTTQHNKEIGYYQTHIYAWDYADNQHSVSAGIVDVPITKGVFRVACKANPAVGLDIDGRKTENGSNVQIWTYDDSNNQKFKFTRRDDGYYTIVDVNSGRAVNLAGGVNVPSTNVHIWDLNDDDASSLWKLVHNEDGSYSFLSKVDEAYVLDVNNADYANGTNVQIWTSNTTDAQKWYILPAEVTSQSGGSGYNDYRGGRGGSGNIIAYGVDVSEHQGVGYNFQALKNSGYDYAILRCGFVSRKDYRFEEYYNAAKAAGLNVGAYFYSYATNASEASNEADQCLSFIAGKTFEYPIYFDFEDKCAQNCDARSVCLTFMDKIAAAGYLTGLYGYAAWLDEDYGGWVPTAELCQKYECWIANYPYASYVNTYTEKYKTRYGMFQFTDGDTSLGLAAGAGVDTDISFKDYPSIVKQYGFNGYPSNSTTTVVPTDDDYNNTTGIRETGSNTAKTIERIEYVDLSGQVSDKPSAGFNVIVTIYTDGSRDVQKRLLK